VVDNLQTVYTDLELLEAVTQAVESMPLVRETHVPVEITVESGVVTLNGVVMTGVMRRGVLYKASTTPGVQKVIDNLYEDPQIENAVAHALATDDSLKELPFVTVRSYRGNVTLSGKVTREKERAAVIAIASGVEGVRDVIDELTIAESE
jgi:osmotically-inducible protein OsmY